MIAALAIAAASLLAPSGVTATIQADPVCLNTPAQPGTVYEMQVYAPGASPQALSVTPAHGSLERTLHQVQPSWVRFAPDRGTPDTFLLDLTVPAGAATGAYWSDIKVTTQPSGPGDVSLGTAGTTALVFTVGPSATPPPPCNALDVAQSTLLFPPWPDPRFATTSKEQALKQDDPARRPPEDTCPTATAGPAASAAPSYCPGVGSGPAAAAYSPAAATSTDSSGLPADWPGWAIIIVISFLVLRWLLKLLGIGR